MPQVADYFHSAGEGGDCSQRLNHPVDTLGRATLYYGTTCLNSCMMQALTDTEAIIYRQISSISFSSMLGCVSVLSVVVFAGMNKKFIFSAQVIYGGGLY